MSEAILDYDGGSLEVGFARLYQDYGDELLRFFERRVGDAQEAEDLRQETMRDLCKRALSPPFSLTTGYLFEIAESNAIDHYRKRTAKKKGIIVRAKPYGDHLPEKPVTGQTYLDPAEMLLVADGPPGDLARAIKIAPSLPDAASRAGIRLPKARQMAAKVLQALYPASAWQPWYDKILNDVGFSADEFPGWRPIDRLCQGKATKVISDMGGARCITSIGVDFDSYLLPLDYATMLLRDRLRRIMDGNLLQGILQPNVERMVLRADMRAKMGYTLQIVGPMSALWGMKEQYPEALRYFLEGMDSPVSRGTVVGPVPQPAWEDFKSAILGVIPFPSWTKINAADDSSILVLYDNGLRAAWTDFPPNVNALRRILNTWFPRIFGDGYPLHSDSSEGMVCDWRSSVSEIIRLSLNQGPLSQ